MSRRIVRLVLVVLALLAALPAAAWGAGSPGAPGLGDPYFPLDGNGGYDVRSYDLDLAYQPSTGVLSGWAVIDARATQRLSRFDLDLVGMHVGAIVVDGAFARWTRDGQELVVTPRRGIGRHERFRVVVRYDGVPEPTLDPLGGQSGFIATDDGFDVAGQPHGAASWFPVNDHPLDAASYRFRVAVPQGLEVVANGALKGSRTRHGWTTWTWEAREPMASYLTTVNVGEFAVRSYRADGIRYWDAVDPNLYDPVAAPSTGTQFALSQAANSSYKRLAHTVTVPAGGATVDFTMTRDTEFDWDYVFVEAHTVGQDDWTTLPDANGHTTQATGNSCLVWPDEHPFIVAHYQTVDQAAETCEPTGATGVWWAASGAGAGAERWSIDLSAYAGTTVEVAIAYASDGSVQRNGLFVDDIDVSTGEGTTSFEAGLDGWTVPGPPAGSPGNENDWIVGTAADVPPPTGAVVDGSLARQPEIVAFLSSYLGPYPWSTSGGIVDDVEGLGFALETQTRPIYARDFFTDSISGDGVVVHELAHQWTGDSLRLARWGDIWLHEGFATYAEWLWSEREGLGTAQEIFDFFYAGFIPDDHPWWQLVIGDPGPDLLFEYPVYFRGAMTLHALRLRIGDEAFFRLVRCWTQANAGETVTTPEFIRLAERVSGQQLDDLFQTWLYTAGKPVLPAPPIATARVGALTAPAVAEAFIDASRRSGALRR